MCGRYVLWRIHISIANSVSSMEYRADQTQNRKKTCWSTWHTRSLQKVVRTSLESKPTLSMWHERSLQTAEPHTQNRRTSKRSSIWHARPLQRVHRAQRETQKHAHVKHQTDSPSSRYWAYSRYSLSSKSKVMNRHTRSPILSSPPICLCYSTPGTTFHSREALSVGWGTG